MDIIIFKSVPIVQYVIMHVFINKDFLNIWH